MIKSFGSKGTEDLFHGENSKDAFKIPQNIWRTACRKLDLINAAAAMEDLKVPPGNHLEALKGDLRGRYSIRINDQYRIVFAFKEGHAYEVEIVDYH